MILNLHPAKMNNPPSAIESWLAPRWRDMILFPWAREKIVYRDMTGESIVAK